jgi:hypothetical protein
MRIHFERGGGFAGIRLKSDVDTASLPPDDAKVIEELVKEAHLEDLPAVSRASAKARDTFEYLVSVEDGGNQVSVRMTDGAIPPSVQPLIARLLTLAKNPRPSA